MPNLENIQSFLQRAMAALQEAQANGDAEGIQRYGSMLKRANLVAKKAVSQAQQGNPTQEATQAPPTRQIAPNAAQDPSYDPLEGDFSAVRAAPKDVPGVALDQVIQGNLVPPPQAAPAPASPAEGGRFDPFIGPFGSNQGDPNTFATMLRGAGRGVAEVLPDVLSRSAGLHINGDPMKGAPAAHKAATPSPVSEEEALRGLLETAPPPPFQEGTTYQGDDFLRQVPGAKQNPNEVDEMEIKELLGDKPEFLTLDNVAMMLLMGAPRAFENHRQDLRDYSHNANSLRSGKRAAARDAARQEAYDRNKEEDRELQRYRVAQDAENREADRQVRRSEGDQNRAAAERRTLIMGRDRAMVPEEGAAKAARDKQLEALLQKLRFNSSK